MIKNTYIACIIILFSAIHVSAQDFGGGLLVGMTASQIDGDSQSGYGKAGIVAGGYVQREVYDLVVGQMELRFTQKGAYNKSTGDRLTINYIDIPILAKYEKWGAVFEAGIIPGVLISSKVISGLALEYDAETHKKAALDVAVGLSYMLFEKMAVNARLNYSVLAVNSISNSRIVKKQYSNWLQFGCYFSLK